MVFQNLPRPFGHYEPSIEWIDDKDLARQEMARAYIPIPRGGTVKNVNQALELFAQLDPPVVIKPRMGSFGRHTHLHLRTKEDVKQAFASARQLCPWVIVEEELQGFNFRATVIGGKFVAALHRDFPRVTGDGVHTIRELLEEENKNPQRQGDATFFPILMDKKAEQYLAHGGRTWDDIPAKDESVAISGSNGRPRGALIHDATEGVHPENIRLFERIARVTRDPLMGIDFIAETLTKPWYEQRRAGVNELNTMPFLDTHSNPYSGTPRNVTGMLWDLVFPLSHAS
jgi:cyanophycin synthetase